MKYLSVALISLLAAGCMAESNQQPISSSTLNPPNSYYKDDIKAHIRATLKDPDSIRSVRISDPFPMSDALGNPRWMVCVEYNAKNGYGAYVGVERYTYKFAYARMWGPHDSGSPVYSGVCGHATRWSDWKI